MPYARILGTGSYLPDTILTNTELAKRVETTDEWIVSRTGIQERRLAAEGQLTSDLAYRAALRAIEAAGIEAASIEMIIVATTTPDMVFPSTAVVVQERLGLAGVPAFDVQAVCAGFMYAFATANAFIRSGQIKRALVIGAETLSRLIDWDDRRTCILFGDGAGAVVLGADEDTGVLSTELRARARRATRPRPRARFRSSHAGFWPGCATSALTASPRLTQPLRNCSPASTSAPFRSCRAAAPACLPNLTLQP